MASGCRCVRTKFAAGVRQHWRCCELPGCSQMLKQLQQADARTATPMALSGVGAAALAVPLPSQHERSPQQAQSGCSELDALREHARKHIGREPVHLGVQVTERCLLLLVQHRQRARQLLVNFLRAAMSAVKIMRHPQLCLASVRFPRRNPTAVSGNELLREPWVSVKLSPSAFLHLSLSEAHNICFLGWRSQLPRDVHAPP
jgi:hypothetical protein